ncbi:MAG: glycosyltransferase [Actinomycetota bacterium]|nr:glycosyltransferase [Actinomycetota bacterium]
MTAVAVILPAHNEAALLEPVVEDIVRGLREWGNPFEVWVMENGSADATADIAESLSRTLPEVRAHSSPAANYGLAVRQGILESDADVAVLFDVDYYDLPFLMAAVALMEAPEGDHAAIVLGSKRAPGASDERPWQRRTITAAFNLVLHRGFGLAVTDTHGMKALDRRQLLPIIRQCELNADLFDTELVIRAGRAGLPITEMPVTVREQRPPRSSILVRGMKTVGGLRRLRRALRRPTSPPS